MAAIRPYHDCSFPSGFLLRPARVSLGLGLAGTGSAGERGTGGRRSRAGVQHRFQLTQLRRA
jgi:hypothetical protein